MPPQLAVSQVGSCQSSWSVPGTKVRSCTISGIWSAGMIHSTVDQRLLGFVGDQIAGSLARIDAEAGDTPGVVVVEHQPRTLLVGIVVCLAAIIRCRTVGYTGYILTISGTFPTLAPLRVLVSRRISGSRADPLVRGPIADPRGDTAVQVQRGAVVLEAINVARITVHSGLRTSSMTVPRFCGLNRFAGEFGPGPEPIMVESLGRNKSPSAPSGRRL